MTDITTLYDEQIAHCDWEIAEGDLKKGDDLQTAILISLFTDRLANADDEYEDNNDNDNRRGWWGDLDSDYRIGSRFWLLRRKKLTKEVAIKAEQYAKEALKWLVDDGIVKFIELESSIRYPDRLYLKITYIRPDKDSKELLQFYWVWEK